MVAAGDGHLGASGRSNLADPNHLHDTVHKLRADIFSVIWHTSLRKLRAICRVEFICQSIYITSASRVKISNGLERIFSKLDTGRPAMSSPISP